MKHLIAAAVIVAALASARASAQETDTEKAAARDVMRKMAELEQSLDVPGLVTRLTGADVERDAVVARAKELMDKELLAIADDIATHPEIGFEEKRSIGKLTDYLGEHNFDVHVGVANLPTASRSTAAVPVRPISGSSSSTTRCEARRARFTAINTARRGPSVSPSPSRSRSSSRARIRRAA